MKAIKIYPNDSVAVALENLEKGLVLNIEGDEITLQEDIPNAHKFALTNISKGDKIIKFGNPIGLATEEIKKGEYIHTHNVETCANSRKEYNYNYNNESILPGNTNKTFWGYERSNKEVGIRNYLSVIPTVFCANGPLQKIASLAAQKYSKSEYFDGILPLTHPYGCSQTGKDLEMTGKIIAGLIKNSNFGGVLVVSLGCEINDLVQLKKYIGDFDTNRIKFLVLQDSDDEIKDGLKLCDDIMEEIKKDKRSEVNISKLHIAVNCGGSDGFSGITANKILGYVSNKFVKQGATINMTEVPEMFGAEHILMNRAVNKSIFDDIVKMINDYSDYFRRYGEKVSDNPTQGNKAGGLSTIEEKSLGCIQKAGICAVTEVLNHGERASKNGLVLISGPGNDLTGITGQIASGAVLTVFTTGRGTPCGFGGPTFRISSNSKLSQKKSNWIDFNAGILLESNDEKTMQECENNLYSMIIETANGTYRTKNEENGYYQIGILRDGVTL